MTLGENGVTDADLAVHDETSAHGGLAFCLSQFAAPLPLPLGVFRAVEAMPYETLNAGLAEEARRERGKGTLERLLSGGHTWNVN